MKWKYSMIKFNKKKMMKINEINKKRSKQKSKQKSKKNKN